MSEENKIEDQIKDLEAQIQHHEENIAKTEAEAKQQTETPSAETSNPAVETAQMDDEKIKEMVEARVAAELKSIKSKLDEAYSARDTAVKQRVQLEDEKRQAEIKRMEEEGRHKEVAELKMAELQAKFDSLQKENVKLSRDHAVTDAMRSLEFRSDIASDMARDRITNELVQDEVGIWRHRSGVSIKEYVDSFGKDDQNAFLFKAKTNSGAGTQTFAAATDNKQPSKPITDMSSEELLQHFAAQPQTNPGF